MCVFNLSKLTINATNSMAKTNNSTQNLIIIIIYYYCYYAFCYCSSAVLTFYINKNVLPLSQQLTARPSTALFLLQQNNMYSNVNTTLLHQCLTDYGSKYIITIYTVYR